MPYRLHTSTDKFTINTKEYSNVCLHTHLESRCYQWFHVHKLTQDNPYWFSSNARIIDVHKTYWFDLVLSCFNGDDWEQTALKYNISTPINVAKCLRTLYDPLKNLSNSHKQSIQRCKWEGWNNPNRIDALADKHSANIFKMIDWRN